MQPTRLDESVAPARSARSEGSGGGLPPARPAGAGADRPRAQRAVAVILIGIVVALAIGALLTWPERPAGGRTVMTYDAVVTSSTRTDCGPGSSGCLVDVRVRLLNGMDEGTNTTLTFVPGATDPKLKAGTEITVNRGGSGADVVYAFADIHRGRPILLLAIVFVVVAIAIGRRRGLAALLGLAFAGLTLALYLIPALLAGESPVVVALVAGGAVTVVALPIAHGVSMRTSIALLGSLAGMAVAALLAAFSVSAMHFTGLSSDEAATLQILGSRSSVSGLLLCGAVIGALGVLNDVTVTQASAVYELAEAGPQLSRLELARSGARIGRDHIASTIYSLVLAYAGASLPLLLLFSVTGQSVLTVLTSDAFAPDVVSGLIGATALVLMVPFTTALAAALVDRPSGPTSYRP